MRKKDIVDHVLTINTRINEINKDLAFKEDLLIPNIDKETEYPETFFDISENDIDEFKFQKEVEIAKKKGQPLPERPEVAPAKPADLADPKDAQLFPNRKGAKA